VTTYSVPEIYQAGVKAGWNPAQSVVATALALAESGGRSEATNQDSDHYVVGPWQINMTVWGKQVYRDGWTESCLRDLSCAASAAYKISKAGRDWTPWETFTNGDYKKFLQKVIQEVGKSVTNPGQFAGDVAKGVGIVAGQGVQATTGLGADDVKRAAIGTVLVLVGLLFVASGLLGLAMETQPAQAVKDVVVGGTKQAGRAAVRRALVA
jgi:hypothetical protein